VEFTLPLNGSLDFLSPGAAGATTVQFVPDGNSSNVNVGFNNPIDYSQDAPPLITPITFVGSRSSAARDESIVGIGYNQSGDLSAPASHTTYARISATGTLYGMIYQRQSKLILAGAYMKSYADLGPAQASGWLQNVDPAGAIYASRVNATLPNEAVYANLNKIIDPSTGVVIPGNPAGVNPRQTSPYNYTGNACPSPGTTTPTTPTIGDCWNHDPAAWDKVGSVALGDLEEDDQERFVFVVNLADKKLYQLPIDPNPANWPITTLAASPVAIPNSCAVSSDAVPGGLGFKDGKLYVGVTCTAKSSQNIAQLKAEVWEFNPTSQTFSATPSFSMPLNYTRGCIWTGVNTSSPSGGWFGTNDPKSTANTPDTNCETYLDGSSTDFHNVKWNPWPQTWQAHYTGNKGVNAPGKPGWVNASPQLLVQIEYPHPWLSDIAFDGDDILLGFRDINGDRTGNQVRSPNISATAPPNSGVGVTNDVTTRSYVMNGAGFGDLMRACGAAGAWTLESNGVCGSLTSINGQNRGQGPGTLTGMPTDGSTGAGEFYWDDSGPGSRNPDAAMSATWAFPNWGGIGNAANNDGYYGHEETLKGGLFQRSGAPDLAITQADQLDRGDGGIARFSNVVDHPLVNDPAPGLRNPDRVGTAFGNNEIGIALRHTALYGDALGFFGKANGLGDVEALVDPAPIEIGNRLWIDANGNGRQDPGEATPSGVSVELWVDNNGDGLAETQVGTATTNASGLYYFGGLSNANMTGGNTIQFNKTYEIRINRGQSALSANSIPTVANADPPPATPFPDLRDSDGVTIPDTGGSSRNIAGVRFTTGGPGANNHTYDFGFISSASLVNLGNQVWFDFNNDGLLNNSEVGIDGVKVDLYADTNGDGRFTPGVDTFIDTQTTATVGPDAGIYNFTSLLPGDYIVHLPQSNFGAGQPLNGMASSTGNNPTPDPDNNVDNDDNGYHIPGNGVASLAVTLTSGTEPGPPDTNTNPTVDFGFFGLGAVGNYVWVDENSDGYQDEGEPGIPNVQVNLYSSTGVLVATTYTDSHGGYLFDNLRPGTYYVDVLDGTGGQANTLPAGMTQTPPSTLPNADFGNQAHNTAIPSTGFTGYPVTIGGNQPLENLTADFGYNYNPAGDVNNPPANGGGTPPGAAVAALGDRVWIDSDGDGAQDPNEIGVSGVTVQIFTAGPDGIFGTPDDVAGATQTTNANGYYMFDGLAPGAYVVKVVSDAGASHAVLTGGQYNQTGDPDHFGLPNPNPANPANADNATTTPVLLGPGDVFLNADFGYQPSGATLGSIGDTIWFDADADGTGPSMPPIDGGGAVTQGNPANPADPAEYGIPGVTVTLIRDSNGDGRWNAGEPIIATTTTNANGQYLFPGLPLTDGTGTDDYIVWVNDSNNVLGEMIPTYDKDGRLLPASPSIRTGLGISAVTNLGTTGGSPYGADNVRDQDFGYTNTYQQPNPQNTAQPLGLIGDYVWFDVDRDNVQDADERGVEGVVVELLDATGTTVIATTVTDENGHYSFGGLPLNQSYIVRIPSSNFDPGRPLEGMTNTGGPVGGSGNAGPVVNLTPANPINLVQDFGYAAPTNAQGSIGNQVWEDLNADGIRQAGEPAIAGVTVDLYRDLNGNGTVDPGEPLMGTRITDVNGQYLFSALPIVGGGDADPEAEYVVDVTDVNGVLAGYWHSLAANQDPNTGVSGNTANDANDRSKVDPFAIEIGSGSGGQPVSNNLNVDFGYYVKPASVGNFVWQDLNSNGIQDSGEPGIDGLKVTLTIFYPDGTTHTVATLTGDDPNTVGTQHGWYSFGNLLLDEDYATSTTGTPTANQPVYRISVPTGGGYVPTTINVGSNDMIDSDNHAGVDAVATQGSTNVNQLTNNGNGETNPIAGYDFGYISTPLAVLLAGFDAASQADHVLVSWETVSEANNAGFNLYRSLSADGEYTLLGFTPSASPGSTQGAAYSYQDFDVTPGQTLWYQMEDIDLSGAATMHGPVSVVYQAPTAVTLSSVQADGGQTGSATLMLLAGLLAAAGAVVVYRRRNTAA
jgi:protocatechuate 3,4-dioxygenase beta subunit